METFSYYKGYGIKYKIINGTAYVTHMGFELKAFIGLGDARGKLAAKTYIDKLIAHNRG